MGKRVRVFLNESSGTGCDAEEIESLFARHDCACKITRLSRDVDAGQMAKDDAPEVVFVAAGGDGTVNVVASALAESGRRMGVLPVGTLNHFGKDLGLPLELKEAVAAIARGTACGVDAGEVNGQIFVNNSSIGAYPGMVVDRERMKKGGANKWASLVAASVKAFVRFRCMQVELEVHGKVHRCTTPFVFVGNNEYCMDGMRLGGREQLDRGELAVYLAPGASRMTILRMAVAVCLGRLKQVPEFTEYKVKSMTVNVGRRNLRVSYDGEVKRMRGPLRYAMHPGSLQVIGAKADAVAKAG